MVRTCVDPVIDQLSEAERCGGSDTEQYGDSKIQQHGTSEMKRLFRSSEVKRLFETSVIDQLLKSSEQYLSPVTKQHGSSGTKQYGKSEIEVFKRGLRFLKMILWCIEQYAFSRPKFLKMILWCCEAVDYNEAEMIAKLRSLLIHVKHIWEGSRISWDWSSDEAAALDRKIQQSKQLVEEYCEADLFYSSRQCDSLGAVEILEFLDLILQNLGDLLRYKADIETVQWLNQIKILQQKLTLLQSYFQLASHGCKNCKEVRDFKSCIHAFANRTACLIFLCWMKDVNEATTAKINLILCDIMQGFIKPCDPDICTLYFGALMAIKLQQSEDTLLLGRTVANFVDLLLENLLPPSTDLWQIFRDSLIFLLTFMADPPRKSDQDQQLALICSQIDVLLKQCLSFILLLNDIKEDSDKVNIFLCDFARKIDMIKDKIGLLYVKPQELSFYPFPRTNGLVFYESLLQKLERLKDILNKDTTFIPFAKNFVIKIEEELLSLSPFLNGIFNLQQKQAEYRETWLQIIDLAQRTEHVINECPALLHPIWYCMVCLYDILEQIEATKRMLEKVKRSKIYNTEVLPSLQSVSRPSERANYPMASYEVIGFRKEAKKITDELIWGSKSLNIISIIGMGGLGKTTLAKKVYDCPSVKSHFHEFAFCYVSQVHDAKRLLLDILKGITGTNDGFSSMKKDDLAHELWKHLSGKRYLVVLDDVWDIRAWDEVKESFPKETYGSRIIFTTRSHIVASESKSSAHKLGFLSEDESFELLEMKVFGKDGFPPNFIQAGKIVSKSCKGLPLAIVVVAGLLASTTPSPPWWKEIAETTSYFSEEGCKDIIGLSYKHLPENLKACFLYLSISEEDELIPAKTLELLWISEGFVNKSPKKSLRILAKEYMRNLVDRNLVIAVNRTSRGNIRTCRLHDLVRDFCKRQAEEDNFVWLRDRDGASNSSKSNIVNHYRVCYQRYAGSSNDIKQNMAANIHSLLDLRQGLRNKQWKTFVLRDLKHIQVLTLRVCNGHLFSDEFQLVDLLHLRHIQVEGSTECPAEVPESICNLWNLETFIWKCYGADSIRLPKTIWKMKRLRHLEFYQCNLDLGDDVQEGSVKLDNMESFSGLILMDNRTARKVLKRLPNIQKLDLRLDGSQWTDQVLTIDFLDKLESLELWLLNPWVDFKPDFQYSSIRTVTFPSTLKRLELRVKPLVSPLTELLSAIGELPCLEVLKLKGYWRQWVVEGNKFQKLKYLRLKLYDLEQWIASDDSFPCLGQLDFHECFRLEEIPYFLGELPTLQRIGVHDCSDKVESSAIQIKEEQMDAGKVFDLEIFKSTRERKQKDQEGERSTEAKTTNVSIFLVLK